MEFFVAVGMIPNNQLVPDFVNTDDAGYVIADETGKQMPKDFLWLVITYKRFTSSFNCCF